ncbi:MAG: ExbD/TolR family protein, partial [Terrimicrobiaceae bacterium]
SLIDILAILLIFFIVTTTFRKKQPQVQINLPESKAAETAPAATTEPVVLRVKNSDQISLDDKPVALDQLAAAIQAAREAQPKRGIALQADREAPFGVVVKVLDALKQAGIQDVPAFTQPEPGKP